MTSKISPSQISVHPDLEEARPISVNRFREIMSSGDSDDESVPDEVLRELNDTQRQFYQSIVELAGSVKASGLYYPVTTRKLSDGTLELVTGYRRYLSCIYIGRPVEYETRMLSESDILSMMYNENENRHDLDPYDRAVVMAKQMGIWCEEREEIKSPEESDGNGMTIAEFAQKTGKSRALIFQQLSPIRQDQRMREEFGDSISESSLQLIESICDKDSQQYTLAQSLHRSNIDTHSSFSSRVKMAKRKSDTTEELIQYLCRTLMGVKFESVKGSYVEHSKNSTIKTLEKHEQKLKERERREKNEIRQKIEQRKHRRSGQILPEPQKGEEIEIEFETPDKKRQSDLDNEKVLHPDVGVGVLPDKNYYSDDELDVTVPGEEEISALVREEADERNIDEGEFVADILKIHFRREGQLQDTPEVRSLSK